MSFPLFLNETCKEPSSRFEAQNNILYKTLRLTCMTSGEMEDPLALLVNSEQAGSERIHNISEHDIKSPATSPTPSSKAGSAMLG